MSESSIELQRRCARDASSLMDEFSLRWLSSRAHREDCWRSPVTMLRFHQCGRLLRVGLVVYCCAGVALCLFFSKIETPMGP